MRLCPCGSGQWSRELLDAAGIYCGRVCDDCEKRKRAEFRSEVFDEGTAYARSGEEEDLLNDNEERNLSFEVVKPPKPAMVPTEVVAAITAARPELLRMGTPRAMDADEVRGMYEAIAMLIQDGFAAQQKAARLETQLARSRDRLDEVMAAIHVANHAASIAKLSFTDEDE